MTKVSKREEPDEYDRPTEWARGLQTNQDLQEFYDLGLIGCSIEGIIRFNENKGGCKKVDINNRTLAEALIAISDRRCEKEFMILALQGISQALFGLDGAYTLEIKQERRGRTPPQLSENLTQLNNDLKISQLVADAKARRARSPNKVAAQAIGCEPHVVKRAKKRLNPATPVSKD